MAGDYFELLKHPNWQRKRLEVMERADFACEYCGCDDQTLNVHHSYYEKGLSPWEYPDESLHCLCEECHKKFQHILTLIKRQLGKIDLVHMTRILGYAIGVEMLFTGQSIEAEVIDGDMAWGLGDAFGITANQVMEDASLEQTVLSDLLFKKALAKSCPQDAGHEV